MAMGPDASGLLEINPYNHPFMDAPHAYAQRLVSSGRLEDGYNSWERDRSLLSEYSNVLEPYDELAIAYRTARFLDANGHTRAEIFWAPEPGALALSRRTRNQLEQQGYWKLDQFLISVSAVQKNLDHIDLNIYSSTKKTGRISASNTRSGGRKEAGAGACSAGFKMFSLPRKPP